MHKLRIFVTKIIRAVKIKNNQEVHLFINELNITFLEAHSF